MKISSRYKCRACDAVFNGPTYHDTLITSMEEANEKIHVSYMGGIVEIPNTDMVFRTRSLRAPLIIFHNCFEGRAGLADLIYLDEEEGE